MGDEEEADCCPNPCYSAETGSHNLKRAVAVNIQKVGDDKEEHLYELVCVKNPPVKPEVHVSAETSCIAKPLGNGNKWLVVIFICIATASVLISSIALIVSINGLTVIQSNQTIVTQDPLEEARNNTLIDLENAIQNVSSSLIDTVTVEFEQVDQTLYIHENNIQNLSRNLEVVL